MKIFFDARWTRVDTIDGITRYGANLVAALHKLTPVTMLICDMQQLQQLPEDVPYVLIQPPISFRELFFARRLNKLGADVVISPMQIIGGGKRRYKLLLTLHDVIYYHHAQAPTFLPLFVRIVWRLFHVAHWPGRVLLERADCILTVSETSKKLIAQELQPKRPIIVIPDARTYHNSKPSQDIQKSLIYIGSFMPYKNVEALMVMMAYLSDYTLHLLGKVAPGREAQLRSLAPPKAKIVFHGGVSDTEYARLLHRATALVTASRDEGFGLPLIEAMSQGTPVICSDIPVFHEVGGDAALFAAVDNPEAFAAQVRSLEKYSVRKYAIRAGYKTAARYTWEQSAAILLSALSHYL